MKKILSNIVIVAASVSLVSCAANTQKENTVAGAGTGAVVGGIAGAAFGSGAGIIAAGAAVGALIGGVIGHTMDSSDHAQVAQSVNSGQASTWQNSKSNTTYKVVPSKHFITINGNPHCRHFTTYATTVDGKTTKTQSTACRQANGTWTSISH